MARIMITTIVFLLDLYAFWSDGLGGGHVPNPSGIAFLLLAAGTWFGWETIRAAFAAAKDESNIPIIRLGSAIIRGMRRPPLPRRGSDERA
jgi:hypothetical protein